MKTDKTEASCLPGDPNCQQETEVECMKKMMAKLSAEHAEALELAKKCKAEAESAALEVAKCKTDMETMKAALDAKAAEVEAAVQAKAEISAKLEAIHKAEVAKARMIEMRALNAVASEEANEFADMSDETYKAVKAVAERVFASSKVSKEEIKQTIEANVKDATQNLENAKVEKVEVDMAKAGSVTNKEDAVKRLEDFVKNSLKVEKKAKK